LRRSALIEALRSLPLTLALLASVIALVVAPRTEAGSVSGRASNGAIAFLADGYLKVVDPDGTHMRPLAGARPDTILARCVWPCTISGFAWSPKGTQLAFFRGDAGSGPGCATNCHGPKESLFVINADGSGQRRLSTCNVDCGGEDGLAWSPDGSSIVFSRNGLVTIKVATGKLHSLRATGQQPDWSPDGTTIAYSRVSGLFAVDAAGASAPRRIVSSEGDGVEEPDWSTDGSRIVFGGRSGIYTVRPDGSHRTRLIFGSPGSAPYHASWSPDGKRVLYAYTPGHEAHYRFEVWTLGTSGGAVTRIYRSKGLVSEYYAPVWSPDGKNVAFSWDPATGASDSARGTFVMSVDGTRRHRLISTSSALSWSRVTR
jgi:Tol biopolymer transport system component